MHLPAVINLDLWLRQLFSAQAARDGDVERIVGRDVFERDSRRRGFRAVENAGQYVIFCNREPVHVIG